MADIDKKLPVLPDKDLMIKADLDLSCLVKAYLAGDSIPSFGGNDSAQGRVLLTSPKLPVTSAEELEEGLQQCLLDPSICKPFASCAKPPPKAHPATPLGTLAPLPQVLADWRESGGLLQLHKRALKDPSSLLGENRLGMHLGADIDFGIKRIKPPGSQLSAKNIARLYAELAGHPLHDSSLPEASTLLSLLCSSDPDNLDDDIGQIFFQRELRASYQGTDDALLLDIRCAPSRPHTFAIMDDYGLASNSWSPSPLQRAAAKKSTTRTSLETVTFSTIDDKQLGSDSVQIASAANEGDGVIYTDDSEDCVLGQSDSEALPGCSGCRLKLGQHLPLSVLLDSSDGPHRRAETGIISQFVLFTFAVPATAVAAAGDQRGSCFEVLSGTNFAIAVIGRCISAALSQSPADLQSCLLNVEAKPFISESLRTLFDSEPETFMASMPRFEALSKNSAKQLPTAQEWWMLSQSQTHNTRPASASSRNPPSAAKQSGAAMALWREGHLGKGLVDSGKPTPARSAGTPTRSSNVGASRAAAAQSGLVPEPARKELLALSRLLLLEQTSMEHDIKRFDMFHAAIKYAVFQDFQRGARGTSWQQMLRPWQPCKMDDAAESGIYTGPNLDSLLTPPNSVNRGLPHILLALEVPGLPEKRPGVTNGDIIYLRPADASTVEIATRVITASGSTCLLSVPRAFWAEELHRGMPKPAYPGRFHIRFSFDRSPLLHSELQDAFKASPRPKQGKSKIAVVDERPKIPTKAAVQEVAVGIQELGACRLNAEQRLAVASVMARAGGNMPFALFGPPGTGKTITLVECALQLLKTEPGARLLLCAPQSYSADLLCSALAAAKDGLGERKMLRFNDPRLPPNQTKDDVIKWCLLDESTRAYTLPAPDELAKCSVVVATCSAAALLGEGKFKEYLMHKPKGDSCGKNWEKTFGVTFTHVLIDEAGQALLPEAIIPLTFLQPSGQALLCGDPR
ncbi:hypothetical protein WJX84_004241 [Apatococcus fuscideae]|uniref:DNA2/NAM7 helicase helicase domain-containing protein n=1 Tax=Apatococcus fuscideae TaxID=2026836 RepID=A0AAW1SYA6_9CHLO